MGGGGVQRIIKFLKFWDYSKFEISVLTVKKSYFYAEDWKLISEIPSQVCIHRSGSMDPFRVLSIIKGMIGKKQEKFDGESQESGGLLRKIAGFLFVPDSRLLWLPFAITQIWRLNKREPIDLIVATMPPFTTGIIAKTAYRILGIPYILDFRDAWTENPYIPEISSIHNFLQRRLEKAVLRTAKGGIFVNPNLCDYYLTSYSFLQQKQVEVVRNGYDPSDFNQTSRNLLFKQDDVIRIGIMGTVYSQGNTPETLMTAVTEILKAHPDTGSKILIYFIGKWTREFQKWVDILGIESGVKWVGYLPHLEALDLAKQMHLLALAVQSDIAGSENVTPGRIYEYLYLKKPIIAMCPLKGDLAKLIRHTNSGIVLDYYDLKGVKNFILQWIRDSKKVSKQFMFKNINDYDRRILTNRFVRYVGRITNED